MMKKDACINHGTSSPDSCDVTTVGGPVHVDADAALMNDLEEEVTEKIMSDNSSSRETSSSSAEDKHVFKLKLCLLLLLLSLTVAGAILVHYFISKEDQNKFEYYYHVASSRVLAAIGQSMDNTLGGTDAMAVSMASYASLVNATWPYVTIPNFYLQSNKYAKQSDAVWTTVYHIVTAEQRLEWENYTATHNDWIDKDIAMQATDPNYHGPIITEREDFNVIHGWDEYYKENPGEEGTNRTGPIYLPNWQSAPVIPEYPIYNWDILTQLDSSFLLPVFNNHTAVVSKAYMLPDMNNEAEFEEANITADWFKDYISPDDDPMEPVSDVYYPVFKEMDSAIILDHNENHDKLTLVAVMAVSFYWRDVLTDILPEGTGVDVVFRNQCNPTFTYRIHGSDVTFLGRGDLHETRFDNLEMTSSLLRLNDFSSYPSQKGYTGVPIDEEYCPFHISVYPSLAMEKQHESSNPALFATLAAVVLSLTFFTFVSYDSQVSSRQRKTNRRLEEANHKLRQASALQLRHFAMMSHEIRTPLNGILGMAGLLDGDNLTLAQHESVRMIQSSGELLRTVVDDVLDYSKLAAGYQNIEVCRTDLQECLEAVIYSSETKAKLKCITLQTVFDERVPAFIHTDGRRLQQILFNLLSNAIKFSPEDETVVVGATIVNESGPDGITSSEILRFYVEDHGEGIPKEKFNQIFQPFAQATLQTERVYGGTGLGLSITKKLVEAMGGSISVESELGEYARFLVDIPLPLQTSDGRNDVSDDDDEKWPTDFFEKATVYLSCTDQSTIERVQCIFRHFQLDYQVYPNLQFTKSTATKDKLLNSPDRNNVFLVQEDLFDLQSYSLLVAVARNAVLITFGPQMLVHGSDFHFRNLQQILPSALMLSFYQATKSFDSQATWMKDATEISTKIDLSELRILVAEDNLINQKVICRILKRIGVESVHLVENGKEAVDAEAQEPFDVVLMDMEMPIMDGVEACKQILNGVQGEHAKPQIFFLTAHVTDSHRKECFEAGAVGFLSKPYNLEELTDRLHHLAFRKKTAPVLALPEMPEGPTPDEGFKQQQLRQPECKLELDVCFEV